jgi:hypothetical protein
MGSAQKVRELTEKARAPLLGTRERTSLVHSKISKFLPPNSLEKVPFFSGGLDAEPLHF